jgi:hypothetical protein
MRTRTRNDGHRQQQKNAECGTVCDRTTIPTAQTAGHSEPGPGPDIPAGNEPPQARDSHGRFARGNTSKLIHGLRSEADRADALPDQYRHLQQQIDDFVSACAADEGGSWEAVPARRRSLLEYRARLHRRILQLDTALELHGVVDRRHKLRAAWLGRLIGLISTARNIDSLLGLDRRERDVTAMSPSEWAARTDASTSESKEHDHE